MSTRRDSGQTDTYREIEITEAVQLCDSRGRLFPPSVGWSRQPLHTCNVSGHWPRKKKWNYWCVTSDRCLFSVTLANVDYMGLAFAYFLEYETAKFIEQTVTVPFGKGCALAETVRGDVVFRNRKMNVSFTEDENYTRINVDSPAFGGATLSAELSVTHPADHETLNVVIPWSDDRFQFTSKQNCLPATGSVSIGGETFDFPPGAAFACLDFGRGVWRYSTSWNWASASGTLDGRPVGLNLGGTWTDGTGLTENAIFFDGRISKISEDVLFSYDRSVLTEPWSVRTQSSERIDLRFTPFFERVARTDLLLLRSEVHQLIGRFSGTIVPDEAGPLRLDGMIGWVEQHQARW
jgi:hypothetical protein